MAKSHLLKSLFLATSVLALSAQASHEELVLYKIFHDYQHSVPAQDRPYRLQLDGRQIKLGYTDKTGAIVTDQHQPKTRQEFVADIWGLGIYVFVIDEKDRISVKYLGDSDSDHYLSGTCPRTASTCSSNGFYWIRLLGINSNFASEPYSLTLQGNTVEGAVDADGYLFIPMNTPPAISETITLRLCMGPAISIKVGLDIKDSESAIIQSGNVPAPTVKSCKSSTLKNYSLRYAKVNHGMPYIFSQWANGSTPSELIEQKRSTEQALLKDYELQATANNDRMAWLGALPPTWSDTEFSGRQDKLFHSLKADISFTKEDLLQFHCKTPDQVGNVPSMDAVEAYIDAYSSDSPTQVQLTHLYQAAAQGNWLAIALVYSYESTQGRQKDDNPYIHNYRMLQLREWLHARRIGAVYTIWGDTLNSTGYVTDMPYYYAALHDGYSSQYEIGAMLQNESDPRYRDIGLKMQACALHALPAYGKLFQNTRD
ncbi:hypothetical protein ACFFKC_19365 [Pseudoduganella danionis]|uniref:Uncharacterized protein n=1 Tax=Pseudoduganella danionis TaxID=1890295 RepID=A0ABW9SSX5_9BURK|nr:hypothetical protein [Pseudoduganella danionis]MTW34730.1 hypothetical protein [Pseudoduganella danionis]